MPKAKEKPVLQVPKDRVELERFVFELGAEAREIEKMQIRLESKVKKLEKTAGEMMAPRHKRALMLLEGIYRYAEKHKLSLTEEGKRKTVELLSGILQWPPLSSGDLHRGRENRRGHHCRRKKARDR